MTTEELSRLTPDEKRIAIAEACGWRDIAPNPFPPMKHCGFNDGQGKTEAANCGSRWGINDYLSDLNAMHEAEKTLTDEQYIRFEEIVYDLVCDALPTAPMKLVGKELIPTVIAPVGYIRGISATAAQRADAFLLTI